MMMSHTPGPWTVAANGTRINDSKGGEVGQAGGYLPFGEQRANAKLMAAAPRLLHAVQAVLRWVKTEADEDAGAEETMRGALAYCALVAEELKDIEEPMDTGPTP